MWSVKGTNGAPTVALERPMSTERGMAFGGRPLWSRSPRSSPSRGKPGTWRRRTGVNDGLNQGDMHNATSRNCTERHSGFPPTSSNNIAKPTCAKANRHTAVTYSTMKITPSWHSTSRSSGASSTTTFRPTTSLTWGDCEASWRCRWHGPLRQSTDCGFPPTSSNNIAKPTCAKANRHTAVTYSTMKITPSWHSTSRSSGASSTTTFRPTTSLTWGDCEASWRCRRHGPLRQSTSPAHGRCDASTRASWTPSTGRASASRLSSNGTTASHLAWHISVAYL